MRCGYAVAPRWVVQGAVSSMTTSLAVLDESASLPALVRRAASQLASATTAAEVLDARVSASAAYDVAKTAGRLAKAKQAHDDVIAAVYRAQADALEIEAMAKRRLADEYDAAQERGEVARNGGGRNFSIPDGNTETTVTGRKMFQTRTFIPSRSGGAAFSTKNDIPDENIITVSDIGLTSKEVHEARQIFQTGMSYPPPS